MGKMYSTLILNFYYVLPQPNDSILALPACRMLVNPSTYCSSMSNKASTKPMRYIETAMELANVNMRPMAPPNSGPRRTIKSYW